MVKISDIYNIFKNRVIPNELNVWTKCHIFQKRWSPRFGNYTPISLLSHVYKLLMQVVYTRIKEDLIDTTNLFQLLKGVRQGYISSAILFCIILLAILIFVYDGI